ncbi:uncharacterized protein VTP21DRAFT_11660 [Calcarisporiella thermophila]|uniref:uncharacterized protein n=1 Tax=Calcarisporiella thermophila TaxID=911321 RepID=UPI003742AB54
MPSRDRHGSIDKSTISAPFPVIPSTSPLPPQPQRVIKALFSRNARRLGEISFEAGEFFHVVGESRHWYEVWNPAARVGGMVPRDHFQVLEKSDSINRSDLVWCGLEEQNRRNGKKKKAIHPNHQNGMYNTLYGVVLFDFQAEREDELDAFKGEYIVVMAHCNYEWFVAKPISRLGGPGLIPCSFVNVRDPNTGRSIDGRKAGLPAVEEWKKMARGYEEKSIPLAQIPEALRGAILPYNTASSAYSPMSVPAPPPPPPPKLNEAESRHSTRKICTAGVESYLFSENHYVYLVHTVLTSNRHQFFYRSYADFYRFHLALLAQFPREAGQHDQPRTLPYLIGPDDDASEEVAMERLADLNSYLKELCELPRNILEHPVMEMLFGVRDTDIEVGGILMRSSHDSGYEEERRGSEEKRRGSEEGRRGSGERRGKEMERRERSERENDWNERARERARERKEREREKARRERERERVREREREKEAEREREDDRDVRTNRERARALFEDSVEDKRMTQVKPNDRTSRRERKMGEAVKVKIMHEEDIYVVRLLDVTYNGLEEKLEESIGHLAATSAMWWRHPDNGLLVPLEGDEDLKFALQEDATKLVVYVE